MGKAKVLFPQRCRTCNNGNKHSLAYIIAHLWREFDNFRTSTNNTLNNHNTRINNAQNRADSAYNYAQNVNNNKVDWSTYNGHAHTFTYSTTRIDDRYTVVNSISMNRDKIYVVTSTV